MEIDSRSNLDEFLSVVGSLPNLKRLQFEIIEGKLNMLLLLPVAARLSELVIGEDDCGGLRGFQNFSQLIPMMTNLKLVQLSVHSSRDYVLDSVLRELSLLPSI
mmetsp:Transcript_24567/g.61360  ORF Transcript_24567/g.61360 Transcript_24567/m.61360 type:complete len:104 (-) Transcript_24567:284-595(-)|eukprot:CAMPEP_0174886892 /NCGR_PEP_ID=MMETSP0167-20121228/2138_1 /TAXON_ID=38298 /ORGANISM="Rhodella maculata, Strain CCMP736" /LENGTH=103 /DNA_ID=CAMNT_0016123121 /DNA_START=837 /DNA_END=1148 /DNA_ORIENTATION=-